LDSLQLLQHAPSVVQEWFSVSEETDFALSLAQQFFLSAAATTQHLELSAAQAAFLSAVQQASFLAFGFGSCALAVIVNAKRNNNTIIKFFMSFLFKLFFSYKHR
jgi:hypothetical protein